MTSQQAREILILYWPGAEYGADVEFVEALAVTELDLEIGSLV